MTGPVSHGTPPGELGTARTPALMVDRLGPRLGRVVGSTWLLGAALALLIWPPLDFGHIGASLDDSWIAALHLASHRGLEFGRQIIWVYGPLGFLTVPRLTFVTQGFLSLAYVALVVGSSALTFVWAARRSLPLWAALPMAAAGAAALTTTEHDDVLTAAVVAVVAVWALAVLDPARPRWIEHRSLPVIAGAVGGLEYLVRPSSGLAILLVMLITCGVAFPSRRLPAVATCAASFAVAVLALGLVDGQSPGALLAYTARSVDLMANYADGIAEEKGPGSDYLLAGVALLLVATLAWRGTAGWPPASRLAAFVVVALILFTGFKQTFMKHSPHHISYYFACAVGLGFGSAALRRGLAAPLAGLAALVVVYFAATGSDELVHRAGSFAGWRGELAMLTQSRQSIAAERGALRREEALDAGSLQAVAGKTVHVWPLQTAVMWAYPQLRWDPLPVFQPGVAFTSRLDDLDAHKLASRSAPQRILRTSDDVPPAYAPATRLSLFCHYRQLRAANRWQVLARGTDRCGAARLIASVAGVTDRPISVPRPPRPNDLVLARFRGLEPSLTERVQGLVFKGPRWTLSLGKRDGNAKLAVGVARQPFLLAIPRAVDYPAPFRFAPDPKRLAVGALDPIRGRLHRGLTVDFLAVAVH